MNSITSGSWKTSLGGIGMILTGLLALVHAGQGGTITSDTLTVAITSISGGIGLIFARDNSVSSEVAGVTPQQLAAKTALSSVPTGPSTTTIIHTPATPVAAPATPPTPPAP